MTNTVDRLSPHHDGSMQLDPNGGWVSFDDYMEAVAHSDALRDALENVLGYIDTPISRRRLSIKSDHPEWLTEAHRIMRHTSQNGDDK